MNKEEFFSILRNSLRDNGVPASEIDKSVDYYNEMIADLRESGVSEEDAVARLGDPKVIAAEIAGEARAAQTQSAQTAESAQTAQSSAQTTQTQSTQGQTQNRSHGETFEEHVQAAYAQWKPQPEPPRSGNVAIRVLVIILLILGSPIWLSLLCAFLAVVFALYIAAFAILFAFGVSGLAAVVAAVALLFDGLAGYSLYAFGCGLILVSLVLFLAKPVGWSCKGLGWCVGKMFHGIKTMFTGKGV